MIRGMGRMVAKEYSVDVAGQMFTLPHFRASKGYRWSTSQRRFSTPQVRQMLANKKFDNQLTALRIIEKLKWNKQQKEIKKLQNEKNNDNQQTNKGEIVSAAMAIVEGAKEVESPTYESRFGKEEETNKSLDESTNSNMTKEVRRNEVANKIPIWIV